MSLRRALRVVGADLGPVIALGVVLVPFGVLALPCLFGVPLLSLAFGRLSVVLLDAARSIRGEPPLDTAPTRWVGPLAVAGLAAVALAMGTAAWVALHLFEGREPAVRYGAAFGAALAASIAAGAALAPFALAPFAAADGAPGLVSPLLRSFELTARLGPRRSLRLGATAGRWTGVSLLAAMAIFVWSTPDAALPAAFLASFFGIVPVPPLCGALLADAYVEARALSEQRAADLPTRARLRALGLVLAPAVLVLAVAILVAALTPTPMRAMSMDAPVRRGFHGVGLSAEPQRRDLPGGRAWARTSARGVIIETADGGGAGPVDARFDTTQSALFVAPGERYGGAPGTSAVIVTNGEAWALTIVDADGVRQDDGLTERVLGRLGRVGSGSLALALLLLLVLAWRIGIDLGEAGALDVADRREAGRGRLAALECTLRLGDGARILFHSDPLRTTWHVEGNAWLEAHSGALRFRIPETPIAALGSPAELEDGSKTVLVSRFENVSPAGLRTSSAPWPNDARLVAGTRADAVNALARRATRLASAIALPCVLALGATVIVVITSL